MLKANTYTAKIYVGLVEFSSTGQRNRHLESEVERVCQEYCDDVGLCVTLTPTQFIYTKGSEPGVIVGLMVYPKLEYTIDQLAYHATMLTSYLMKQCGQRGISVEFPENTYYFTREDFGLPPIA